MADQARQHQRSATAQDAHAAELFKQGVIEYGNANNDSALELLRKVFAIDKSFPGTYYYAGIIRFKNGQKKLAKINFTKAEGYTDDERMDLYCTGVMFAEEGDCEQSIQRLHEYLEKSKSLDHKRDAERYLRKCKDPLASDKKSASKRSDSLTKKEHKEDNIPEAHEPAVFEVRIDSLLGMVMVDTTTDSGRRLGAGIRSFTSGNYDNAVREFRKVLGANPHGEYAAQALYNTGICYFKINLMKEAVNQFQQILDRFPSSPLAQSALFLKALANYEQKEPAVAEELFRDFLKKQKKHVWEGLAYEKLGDTYIELGQPKKAIDAYSLALSKAVTPLDKTQLWFKKGRTYDDLGNDKRSRIAYDSTIAIGEKNGIKGKTPDALYRIADGLYKSKEFESAQTFYEKATSKYPDFIETPWGLFQEGNIKRSEKKYGDAIALYRDLVKRFPDDYWAKQASWRIDDASWEKEYRSPKEGK